MSSESESASSAPNPSPAGANPGNPQASPPAATPAAGEFPRPTPRIKIGSERPRSAMYQPTKPAEASATATAEAPAASTAPAASQPEAPAPEAAAAAVAAPSAPAPSAPGKPHRQDGQRRENRKPQEIPMAPSSVPKPNLREKLSAELEAELAEALGEKSLDEIIAGESRGVAIGESLLPETKVRGLVTKVHRDSVFMDLGGSNQGLISLRQFGEKPPVEGDYVEVIVDNFNEAEGFYQLHKPGGAVASADWSQVSEGLVVEARVTAANKGGVECSVGALRGFIPASQVSLYRVENLEELIGQKFNCLITEANPDKRNLVLSRRAVLEKEKEEGRIQTMKDLAPGQIREGTVRSLRDFGAFVDIGGVDGLLHVSQLSWARIKHPSDLLAEGQKIQVKIQKIDPDTQKISLTMRELFESPWSKIEQKFNVGGIVSGKVSKIMQFGAFVELEPGVEGMVHISELAHHRVFRVSDVVKEGQAVDVKVLQIDRDKQRISLSLKATLAKPMSAKQEEPEPEVEETPLPIPKSNKPLKGGLGKASGGESVGLTW